MPPDKCAYLVINENFPAFLSSADFFKITFFEKFFQEYNLSVKQFESRSDPMFAASADDTRR